MKTHAQKGQGNRKRATHAGRPCSSRFKGVCWDKSRGNWLVSICAHGRQRQVGRFDDELAAAQAYDEAARELFGEHARLNFPDGVDAFLAAEAAAAPEAGGGDADDDGSRAAA